MCVLRPTIGEWTLCHRLQRRPATCLRVLVGPARRTGIKVTATAPPNHGRIGSWRSQSCRLDHPNRNYRPLVGDNERRQEIVRRTHLLPKHTLRMAHWRETGRGPATCRPCQPEITGHASSQSDTAGGLERSSFPLTAVVGNDVAKAALLLGAVDPSLGVIITGSHGTCKTVMARGVHALMPLTGEDACVPRGSREPSAVALGVQAPAGPELLPLPPQLRKPSFVTVPLGVTEDRLLGSVNVQESIEEGR
mmetsp:Transcript_27026/g.76152  ORF Transcript_27026/g.76152 Transcript_27026/m.76152 type:complete len:250 (-) Transcript_27026:372-1121(-)